MKAKYQLQWVGDGVGFKKLRLLYIGGSFKEREEKSVTLIDWQWIPQPVLK